MKPAPPVIRTRIVVVSRDDGYVKGPAAFSRKNQARNRMATTRSLCHHYSRCHDKKRHRAPAFLHIPFSRASPSVTERPAGLILSARIFH
jgi:hypothetical protein